MNRILALFLIALMLLGVCSFTVSAVEKTYKITELSGKYKTQGRTAMVNDSLVLEWSASGIEFEAECSGDVSITVDATRFWPGNTGGIYFTVVVDGVVQNADKRIPKNNNAKVWRRNSTNYPYHITKSGLSTFKIAENLGEGKHTFAIYNQTEAKNASFGIYSISLNGDILSAPKSNDLFIEFVGDSITAGLGNLSIGGEEAPLYQDATRGWPYLTANSLNADWSVVAESGITAANGIGWAAENSVSMQTVYPKTIYHTDKDSEHSFERKADVVVVGLGTNDFWTYKNGGKTLRYLRDEFEKVLNIIKSKNPNAKIIWIHGMMIHEADALIKDLIEEMGGPSKGYFSLALPKNVAGGQGHPDLSAQQIYAEELTEFIEYALNYVEEEEEEVKKPTSSGNSSSNTSQTTKPNNSNKPSKGSSYANKKTPVEENTSSENLNSESSIDINDESEYEELKVSAMEDDNDNDNDDFSLWMIILICASPLLIFSIALGVYIILKKRKQLKI